MHGVCWGYWNLISIHAPPRGATPPSLLSRSAIPISIHAPPRGATLLVVFGAIVTIISIHAPPRGATCITASSNSSSAFQFTPLREGRRATKQGGGSVYDISIHAPPRGATAVQHGGADARHFNSRPSARGDGSRILSRRPVGYFNSRPSARGDVPPRNAPHRRHFNSRPSARGDLYAEGADPNEDISIHAPPRGATQARPPRSRRRRYFNSRPSARGDSMDSHMRGEFPFQFTPLREGRRCPRSCCATACLFQFTPLREGRRVDVRIEGEAVLFQFTPLREGRPGHDLVDERALAHISIHAPPRGATAGKNGELPHRRQFQFTPLREGRREKVSLTIFYPLFQFTPLREGRLEGGGKKWWDALLISIHAPPRGATGRVRAGRRTDPYFNSRPSARGDIEIAKECAEYEFQFTPLREGRQSRQVSSGSAWTFQFTPLREGRPPS